MKNSLSPILVQKSSLSMPQLLFQNITLKEIIEENLSENTLIIADDHNFPVIESLKGIKGLRNIGLVLVKESNRDHIQQIKTSKKYNKIISVGGCTALDFGRALSTPDVKIILIPSILSTNCISVDRSVIYFNGNHETISTPVPNEVIISFQILMEEKETVIHRWSSSGFGDLFGNISAAINYVYILEGEEHLKKENIIESIKPYASESLKALNWTCLHFEKFDQDTLKRLAVSLHNSSIKSINRVDLQLNAAGEHDLYYTLMRHQKYPRENPTHGELVTVGTLLSAKIVSKLFNQDNLYQLLRLAFNKLKLPTSYDGLAAIGVERNHILKAMNDLPNKHTFLNLFFKEELLDECYKA